MFGLPWAHARMAMSFRLRTPGIVIPYSRTPCSGWWRALSSGLVRTDCISTSGDSVDSALEGAGTG